MLNWLRAAGAGTLIATQLSIAAAQEIVGSNVDSRLLVALEVEDAAAQAWLPEGWMQADFGGGPFAGANVLLVFIDQRVGMNAAGGLADQPQRQAMVVVNFAAAESGDESRIFVTRTYTTTPEADPYDNAVASRI